MTKQTGHFEKGKWIENVGTPSQSIQNPNLGDILKEHTMLVQQIQQDVDNLHKMLNTKIEQPSPSLIELIKTKLGF
jgi:hypothetical protein